jgi:hypothetical protein
MKIPVKDISKAEAIYITVDGEYQLNCSHSGDTYSAEELDYYGNVTLEHFCEYCDEVMDSYYDEYDVDFAYDEMIDNELSLGEEY